MLVKEQTDALFMKALENAEQVGERSTDQDVTMSNSFAFTAFIMALSPGR